MMFTSDKVVGVDFQEYAYTLIYGAVGLIALLGLVGMCIFIYVQFIK
jgi:preprotein translocase subunit Sss1